MSEALAITDDAALFHDPDFTKAVQDRTRARARLAFHGRGLDRLIEIADGEDDKTALTAITLLGKLAGEFKAPKLTVVTFDDLRKAAGGVPAGPLGGITQITESAIIDVEEEEDGDE